MKILAAIAASLLCAAVLLSCLPVHGEEIVYESLIRLHVLAASDEEADQALKLSVRDRMLEELPPRLAHCENFDAACALVRASLPQLEEAAAEVIRSSGYDYTVECTLTEEAYPTRVYDSIALPAGKYTSLRVIIGGGEGQNWWCVLFPSLCNSFSVTPAVPEKDAYLAAGFTPEQYRTITRNTTSPYKIRFRILELFSALLDG